MESLRTQWQKIQDFKEERRQSINKLQCTLITGYSTEQQKCIKRNNKNNRQPTTNAEKINNHPIAPTTKIETGYKHYVYITKW